VELFDLLEKGELMEGPKLSTVVTDMHKYRWFCLFIVRIVICAVLLFCNSKIALECISVFADKGLQGKDILPCQEARVEHGLGPRNLFTKTHFLSASVWLGSIDVLLMYRYVHISYYSMILLVSFEMRCCWLKCIVQTFLNEPLSFLHCRVA
jgi:hypothetical protein